jgi:hypothetical protein
MRFTFPVRPGAGDRADGGKRWEEVERNGRIGRFDMTKIVMGTYHDKEKVTTAVETLLERGVPVDEISVILTDQTGEEVRSIPVKEGTGVVRGATVGGIAGASLGAVGVTLVATGIVLAPGVSLLAAGPVLALLIGGSGLAGAAMGGPLGMGQWRGLKDVAMEELQRGSAVIAVHSDELAGLARSVLADTGAEAVSEIWKAPGESDRRRRVERPLRTRRAITEGGRNEP